jgi:hypothetical protein
MQRGEAQCFPSEQGVLNRRTAPVLVREHDFDYPGTAPAAYELSYEPVESRVAGRQGVRSPIVVRIQMTPWPRPLVQHDLACEVLEAAGFDTVPRFECEEEGRFGRSSGSFNQIAFRRCQHEPLRRGSEGGAQRPASSLSPIAERIHYGYRWALGARYLVVLALVAALCRGSTPHPCLNPGIPGGRMRRA